MATVDTSAKADKLIRDHFSGDEPPPEGLESAIENAMDDVITEAVNAALDDIDTAVTSARGDY